MRLLLASILSALFLAGCAGPSSDVRSRFGSIDKVPADHAKVVVGVHLAATPQVMDGLLSSTIYNFASYRLTFARVDPQSREILRQEHWLQVAYRNLCAIPLPSCYPYNTTRYQVIAVPPGQYAIESYAVSRVGGAPSHTTRFLKTKRAGTLFNRPERLSIEPESSIYYWTLSPGDVVYIGDFVLDHAYFPVRFNGYRRDDAAALKAAQENGVAVDGTLKHRAFEVVRRARPGASPSPGGMQLEALPDAPPQEK
jgi:hypothetical protein